MASSRGYSCGEESTEGSAEDRGGAWRCEVELTVGMEERQLLGALKPAWLPVATSGVTPILVVSAGVTPILVQRFRGDVDGSVTLALARV